LKRWAVRPRSPTRRPSIASAALFSLAFALGAQAQSPRTRTLDIAEYRVEGADHLEQVEVETALNPFLGPGRTLDDIERARVALEKAYSDKGYQTVTVAIPPQTVRGGVVTLKVTEGKVGRLRVRGARYFLPSEVRRLAPSVGEGSLPNFNDIVHDVYLLNQLPDRRVTPALRPGTEPGSIDVDLNVQDQLPLHGLIGFDNRASAYTTPTRLNGVLHYDNLWQQGHSLTLALQIAPRRPQDATVFSAAYLARFPDVPWLSFSANGVLQNSDVSTLGSIAVQGRGRIFGGRANFTLPSTERFFHTLSAGVDYKRFGKELLADPNAAPITYWPVTTLYSAAYSGDSAQTAGTLSLVGNLRGLSSAPAQFDAKRYLASGDFTYLRADLGHTRELGAGFVLFARVQTQLATGPLVPSEQLTAGGAESVRGYLEAQAAGDSGVIGTVEARTPDFGHRIGSWLDELRVIGFADGARLTIRDRLPEQQWVFQLAGTGGGLRIRAFRSFVSGLDVGVPLRSLGVAIKGHPRVHFRIGAEF
jgi:hemolysin activation/secretion protein